MAQAHVTLFPDPIEVPDDEVEVLRAQGLLREDPQTAPEPVPAPAASEPAPASASAKVAMPKTKESA